MPDKRTEYRSLLSVREMREEIECALGLQRAFASISTPKDTIVVRQAQFSTISKETESRSGISKLETGGLGTCITLILIDDDRKIVVMAHLDEPRKNSLEQILEGRTEKFTRAVVVEGIDYAERSKKFKTDIKTSVLEFAQQHAQKVTKVTVFIAVGVTVDGVVYEACLQAPVPGNEFNVTHPHLKVGWIPRTEAEVRRVFSTDPKIEKIAPRLRS